jgi:hypothetical protein
MKYVPDPLVGLTIRLLSFTLEKLAFHAGGS